MNGLSFHTFSGMRVPVSEDDDNYYLRKEAAEYLLKARERGHSVVILARGREWEIITEANERGYYVTDDDGVLVLRYAAPVDDLVWSD